MVTLKNPEAPASKRQLWRLHELTGEDTTGLKINMQQASDKIEKLELNELPVSEIPDTSNVKVPFDEAKVKLVEGAQGSGKSITGVATVADAYNNDSVRVFCKEVLKIDCEVKSYNAVKRIAKINYGGNINLIRIPESFKLVSPIRIFCNFHLFGIPFVFCPSFRHILYYLKKGIIRDGYLVIDEYYIGGNARESMSVLGRELEKQSFQYRKMQLEVIIITPMAKLIDWTARMIPTERVSCSYEAKTGLVTLEIKKKGVKGTREITYDSRPYRRYYWTNERINA